MTMRSTIARVRGLGSAKHGVEHWWMQRVTAVALIPLTLWFAASLVSLAGAEWEAAYLWIASPAGAVPMILFLVAGLWHGKLGLQVVIEDYIHAEVLKVALLMLLSLATVALGIAGVFAVCKISFGE
ncbi:MAG: succinate dehydrogenase, hydrophobic membrane anchor protein [Alphaproteobacteria bacterium]|nr:succinate dehydrogenase, hydrophobic membrane anchor protein [Alphaproteobacteria bacterium]